MDTTTTASKFNEDDSVSEYTDPENNSAPTELFAEFLASILRKEWRNALKNCKLSNNSPSIASPLWHFIHFISVCVSHMEMEI